MRFLIDGTEWAFPHMESLSREEQLEALREKVSAEGRVIVDMLSDGESLDDGDLLTVPDGIDVDVLTNTPWGLGVELLEEIKDSLLEVFKGLQEILDGAEVFAASMLDGIYASLDWVGEVAEGFRDAYPEYGGALPDAAPLRRSVETFHALMAAGRFAEAQAWHENEWKREVLPPFLDGVKQLRGWFESEDAKDSETPGEDTE
ncbi:MULTISPECIES: hypothetical protein [unclassified Pyramidobacter]|uniref:hypothetical protein n=1 Tax=unclassified Pyramidobacter TaxID=2632171 RepID=UPI000ECD9E7A|nr:hypothetical protein [Pyramidobacter sp. CG50-2]RKJ76045.1 hypothetical protein D7D26_10850 [Pyramidobacter sp. CG50-2]